MSTRPQASPQILLNAVSMATSKTTAASIIQKLSQVSYAVSWTGTSPVGTIAVQASNDYSLYPDGTLNNAGTWNTMPFSLSGTTVTSIPVSGNTGNGFIDIDDMGGYAVRLVYTAASGVGSLTVTFTGKVS